jgi:predicted small secreted protein
MTRTILTLLIMLGILGTLGTMSGCNTVAGAGKDIERGGEVIHDSARDVQKKI